MKRLAALSLLVVLLGAGCAAPLAKTTTSRSAATATSVGALAPTTPAAPTTSAAPTTTAARASAAIPEVLSSTTVTAKSATLTTLAVDAAKLEPAWQAYAAVHSAVEAGTTYKQCMPLVEDFRTELAGLSQQVLSNAEHRFLFDLNAAFAMYSESLRMWKLKLESSDRPADGFYDEQMKERWKAGEGYGNRAGAILQDG